MKKHIFLTSVLVCMVLIGQSQQAPTLNSPGGNQSGKNDKRFWSRAGNTDAQGSNNIFGTMWNSPIYTYTAGIQRMKINGNTPTTSGFIGIGTSNPLFRLHVDGLNTGSATNAGWTKGILMSNSAALMWKGSPNTNLNYFMAHSSTSPLGDFYQGISEGIGTLAVVNYASKVYVGSNIPGIPKASTQIFKNLLVEEGSSERRFGVNVLTPARTAEIKSNLTNNWQLRLTNKTGAWVDFRSRGNGNLNINPQGGRTGINLGNNPTHTIDINGNARIRQVPVAFTSPESLLIGQQVGGNANSREVRRLNFTGNPNQVLLANGTWGTLPSTANADNGISVNSTGDIQLGVPCNIGGNVNIPGILANQLTTDRIIYQKNQHLWFASGNAETGGTGFGGQFIPTPFCGTGNTVEISANMNNSQYGNADASGLRFTKLTASSPIIANGVNGVDNTKVLTVDGDGDVVLTDASSITPTTVTANNGASIDPANPNNVQWGQKCGTPGDPGQLLNIREIPMNGNSVYFTGQSMPYASTFSIGVPCGTTVLSKFGVLEAAPTTVGINTVAGGFKNIDVSDGSNNLTGIYKAVFGEAIGVQPINLATNVYNIGGDFIAKNGNLNFAVRGRCVTMTQYDQASHGGYFESGGPSKTNYGVYAKATGGDFNYGIFAESPTSGGTTGPNYAGFFAGDVVKTGQDNFASDLNLKENIQPINSSLDIVQSLQPKEFEYQRSNFPYMGLSAGLQSGLIAQEVALIIPHLVKDVTFPERFDSLGNQINAALTYKTLNYIGIIPYLIGAIQEQQTQIDSITILNQELSTLSSQYSALEERLDAIEECLSNTGICGDENHAMNQNNSNDRNKSSIEVELNDAQNIVLEQNVPNPFAERTTINYSIPENVQKAQIHFYNQNGQLINTVEIDERGEGQLNVFANDLSTGVYTYTLIVDGRIVSSKRMVRTK